MYAVNAEFPTRAVAACFALACFGVAVIAGLIADRSASSILTSALVCLVIGQVVGAIAAQVIAHVIGQSVYSHIRSNPIPDSYGMLRNPGASEAGAKSSNGGART